MDAWINTDFESSSQTTPQFASFSRAFRRHIKQIFAGVGLELVEYNRGHFYISGFAKNPTTGKFAYFSTNDVRGSNGWLTSLLVRSAEHEKDYTGGANGFAPLAMVGVKAMELTQ